MQLFFYCRFPPHLHLVSSFKLYLFWPSDMRIFYYINRSAILFYSCYVLEASSQSFVVKSYGANNVCVVSILMVS